MGSSEDKLSSHCKVRSFMAHCQSESSSIPGLVVDNTCSYRKTEHRAKFEPEVWIIPSWLSLW